MFNEPRKTDTNTPKEPEPEPELELEPKLELEPELELEPKNRTIRKRRRRTKKKLVLNKPTTTTTPMPSPSTKDTLRKLVLNRKRREIEAATTTTTTSTTTIGQPPLRPAPPSPTPPPKNLTQNEIIEKALGYNPSFRKEGWQNASLFSIPSTNEKESYSSAGNKDVNAKEKELDAISIHSSSSSGDEGIVAVTTQEDQLNDINYDNRGYCFLCWWGHNGEDAVRVDVWNEMLQIWMDNIHTMGELECAAAVSEFQLRRIYKPMRSAGKLVGLFPPEMVIEHFNDHILDPRFEAVSALRSLKLLRREIENNIRKENVHTKESVIDKDQVGNLKSCLTMTRDIYNWNVKKMNFYVPQWRLDSESTKSIFSLQREFVFEDRVTSRKNKKRRNHI